MKKLLNIFRNNLKTQTANDFLPSNWQMVVRKFFQSQGINLEQFSLDDLDDVLMLQSVFNQKSLGQVGATAKNNLILWQLCQFLVAQSYLSENPAEFLLSSETRSNLAHLLLACHCERSEAISVLTGLPRPARGGPRNDRKNNISFGWLRHPSVILRPALALVILFSVVIARNGAMHRLVRGGVTKQSQSLSENPTGLLLSRQARDRNDNKRTKALLDPQGVSFRLELAKPVFAQEKNKDLDLTINLSDSEKTVSNSASRVQNIFK